MVTMDTMDETMYEKWFHPNSPLNIPLPQTKVVQNPWGFAGAFSYDIWSMWYQKCQHFRSNGFELRMTWGFAWLIFIAFQAYDVRSVNDFDQTVFSVFVGICGEFW